MKKCTTNKCKSKVMFLEYNYDTNEIEFTLENGDIIKKFKLVQINDK
jgi:hypothetical protein